MEVGSLYYDLNIDGKKLKSQLDDADKSVQNFGDKLSKNWDDSVNASKKLLLGITAVTAGLVGFGISSVKAYEESQTAVTQLNAVLKSTGEVAGVTAKDALDLSREIQRTTSMSDEAALAVENMALTFTAIHKTIFPQTTKAAIDMATALNHGMKPSAEQAADAMKLLGKALQDPDAGLGALHRVGVNVEELKKKFVGLTDVGEKQRLILAELGTEFGGSAAAQAKTFAGRIDQLKNTFNDLQEQIGQTITGALGPVADWFSKIVDRITEAGGLFQVLKNTWKDHRELIILLASALTGALLPAIISITVAFASFLLTLAPWALLGVAITYGIQDIVKHMGGWHEALKKVTPYLRDMKQWFVDIERFGVQAFMDVKTHLTDIKDLLKFIATGDFKGGIFGLTPDSPAVVVWTLVHNAIEDVVNVIARLAGTIQSMLKPALDILTIAFNMVYPTILAIFRSIWNDLFPAIQHLVESVVRLWNALNPALTDALKVVAVIIGSIIIGALWIFINTLNIAIHTISWLASALADVIGWISNLINWLGNAGSKIISWFKNLPNMILNAIGNQANLLYDIGNAMINGLLNGIKHKFEEVKNFVGGIADWISSHKGPIELDRKLLVPHGRAILEGLNTGLNDGWNKTQTLINNMTPSLSTSFDINANAGSANNSSSITKYGDTVLNIGQINNAQDESYVLRRIDRNSQLTGMGLSPVVGS